MSTHNELSATFIRGAHPEPLLTHPLEKHRQIIMTGRAHAAARKEGCRVVIMATMGEAEAIDAELGLQCEALGLDRPDNLEVRYSGFPASEDGPFVVFFDDSVEQHVIDYMVAEHRRDRRPVSVTFHGKRFMV